MVYPCDERTHEVNLSFVVEEGSHGRDDREGKQTDRGEGRGSSAKDRVGRSAGGGGPASSLELDLLVDQSVVGRGQTAVLLDGRVEVRALEVAQQRIDKGRSRHDAIGGTKWEDPTDPIEVWLGSQSAISDIGSNLSLSLRRDQPTREDTAIISLYLVLDCVQDTIADSISEIEGGGGCPRKEAPGETLSRAPPALRGQSWEDHRAWSIERAVAVDWGRIPSRDNTRNSDKPFGTNNGRHVVKQGVNVDVTVDVLMVVVSIRIGVGVGVGVGVRVGGFFISAFITACARTTAC